MTEILYDTVGFRMFWLLFFISQIVPASPCSEMSLGSLHPLKRN